MNDIPLEDKRKFARIEIEFPVNFLHLEKEKDDTGRACDISFEGIGLSADKEFDPGIPVELQLKIPDGGKPVSVKGKIVWSRRLSDAAYRFGVTLENLDPSFLARALKIKLE